MPVVRPAAIVVQLLLLASLMPVVPVRAAVEAPVLVSPLGGIMASPDVELRWERVPGTVAYRVEAFHPGPEGTRVLDVTTVNDRWYGRLPIAGGTVSWQVSAVGGDGTWGPADSATFTTANPAPVSLWPPDGAVLTHPAESPTLAWRSTYTDDGVYGDQLPGSPSPIGEGIAPGPVGMKLGAWRWQPGPRLGVHPTSPVEAYGELRTFMWTWPDSQPTVVAPPDGAHVAAGTAFRLGWETLAGAGGYGWRLLDAEGDVVQEGGDTPRGHLATWADVPGTIATGAYTWQVRGRLAQTEWPSPQWGEWSEARSVVVDAPPVATGLEPVNGAMVAGWPLLRWTPVDGSVGYEVQVAVDPDSPERATPVPTAAYAFGADDAVVADGPVTRWWRVRVAMASGTGDWTTWRSFTVDPVDGQLAAPIAATLGGPADCPDATCPDVPGVPILRWSPVAGATRYRVLVSWDGDLARTFTGADVAGTAWPLPSRRSQPGARIAWAVVACPSDNDCPTATPSSPARFRMALPAPIVTGPADGTLIDGTAVALDWSPLESPGGDVLLPAITYTVEAMFERAGWTWSPTVSAPGTGNIATSEGSSDGATLTWQVRAEAADYRVAGALSPAMTVTRREPPLEVLGPDPNVPQGPVPVMSWTAPAYTVFGYAVELERVLDPSSPRTGPQSWMLQATGTSVRPWFPLPPGEYRWRVSRTAAHYHSPPESSGPVTEATFTVAGEGNPQLLAPAPGATVRADSIVLEWSPLPEALESELLTPGYLVRIGTSPELPWEGDEYRVWTDSTRHAVPLLIPEGTLYWRVCAAIACSETATLATGISAVRTLTVTSAPVVDVVAPVVRSRPAVALRTGSTVAGSLGVTVSWSATDAGTGIARYEVQVARNAGPFLSRARTSATSAPLSLASGQAYRVRVRAIDRAGNVGAWVESRRLSTASRQESSVSVRWSGPWRRRFADAWWGGSVRSVSQAGAVATTTFTGRAIGWIGSTGPSRGAARVFVDGVPVATVSLARGRLTTRLAVWSRTWPTTGTHTVRIKVLGGPVGNARVDVDGFVILR